MSWEVKIKEGWHNIDHITHQCLLVYNNNKKPIANVGLEPYHKPRGASGQGTGSYTSLV